MDGLLWVFRMRHRRQTFTGAQLEVREQCGGGGALRSEDRLHELWKEMLVKVLIFRSHSLVVVDKKLAHDHIEGISAFHILQEVARMFFQCGLKFGIVCTL